MYTSPALFVPLQMGSPRDKSNYLLWFTSLNHGLFVKRESGHVSRTNHIALIGSQTSFFLNQTQKNIDQIIHLSVSCWKKKEQKEETAKVHDRFHPTINCISFHGLLEQLFIERIEFFHIISSLPQFLLGHVRRPSPRGDGLDVKVIGPLFDMLKHHPKLSILQFGVYIYIYILLICLAHPTAQPFAAKLV